MSNKLLAPNGKPTNLNAMQYELVRTPAFKKWFGDWENDPANASKVVDKNGEPLVVYHTTDSDFSVFNKKKSKEGFFFSANKQRLSAYNKSKILSVFLNLKNPSPNEFEVKGFDGIMDFGNSKNKDVESLYEIIAFEPNQIKLADGTNRLFDANSDDIRFVKGGKVKGDCYLVAGQIAMEIRSKKINYKGTPYLVHAEVKHSTVEGLRFGHAFIEDDENVYDFSNNREIIMPKQLYYYFGDINPKDKKKYRKYTFKQAREKMVSTGNYGCWDIDVEFNKGGSLEDKNTLKAKKIADEAQAKISHLECDGATRVLHYLFKEQNVNHVVKKGSVFFEKDNIPLHFWIELPDGSIVDYKSRMWLGKNAQQGVFKPNKKTEYIGREVDLKVGKFIYEILTMSGGGFVEKPTPDYLKMFIGR